jgi:hypothetical protein
MVGPCPERGPGDGQAGEHVVAIDPQAGEAEPAGALEQRHLALRLDRLGDGPLVVLAEEHHRQVPGRGPDERLVHIALAAGPVAEERDDGGVSIGVTGTDGAVALNTHRVAGRMQGLGTDDDRVEAEVVAAGVPSAQVRAPEQPEQDQRIDVATPGHAVLAVGRERHVLRAQRPAGADLGRLLTEARCPQPKLALALQGGRLGVDTAGQDEVAIQGPNFVIGDVEGVRGIRHAFALGRQQLDEVRLRRDSGHERQKQQHSSCRGLRRGVRRMARDDIWTAAFLHGWRRNATIQGSLAYARPADLYPSAGRFGRRTRIRSNAARAVVAIHRRAITS